MGLQISLCPSEIAGNGVSFEAKYEMDEVGRDRMISVCFLLLWLVGWVVGWLVGWLGGWVGGWVGRLVGLLFRSSCVVIFLENLEDHDMIHSWNATLQKVEYLFSVGWMLVSGFRDVFSSLGEIMAYNFSVIVPWGWLQRSWNIIRFSQKARDAFQICFEDSEK